MKKISKDTSSEAAVSALAPEKGPFDGFPLSDTPFHFFSPFHFFITWTLEPLEEDWGEAAPEPHLHGHVWHAALLRHVHQSARGGLRLCLLEPRAGR